MKMSRNSGAVIVRERRPEDEELEPYAFSMHLIPILIALAFYAAAVARGFAAFDSRDRKWQVSKNFEPDKAVTWDYGVEYDSWTLAHEGLRGEIKDFHTALLTVVKGGTMFNDSQVKAVQKWWKGHQEHMRNHVKNENKITNSLIKERFQLPQFIVNDQMIIEEHLQRIDLNVDAIRHESSSPDRISAVRELLLSWHAYGKDVERHFKAWEQQGISLTRAYFTPEEVQTMTNCLSKLGSRLETGAIVHYVGQSRLRVALSKQHNSISSLSWNLIIQPRFEYYKKNMLAHLDTILGIDRSEELD